MTRLDKITDARGVVASLTVFRFEAGARFWAFSQMAFARALLQGVPGLRFHRLMGSGRGIGFTREPDWNRYALLAAWDDEAAARRFLAGSRFLRRYRAHAAAEASVLVRPISSHGTWDGVNPFPPAAGDFHATEPVAVLTRATIRPQRLRAFWNYVAPVSSALETAPGRIASIGIGELPYVRQATFSIWRTEAEMRAFAYGSDVHREVIRRTREERWYREDLFARFVVLDIVGDFPLQDQES